MRGFRMQLTDIPFGVTDWATVAATHHPGTTGAATWRTQFFGGQNGGPTEHRVRVRMVDYSPGYLADHWCSKGHVLLVLEGELLTELEDGRTFTLRAGMSYQVADAAEAHRSSTGASGARLFIVD
ncbi:DHCW motif cupin fold protein [Deinococcus oregonensis]|uniref:DHCW motif cupin fold protein n=1 Tax=Deinococcus oregonensis TaxID=1805970 RepID=A0ABV6AXQ6_9DEIO